MEGYNPKFLSDSIEIKIPWINRELFNDVIKNEKLTDNYILDYLHYSVVMSKRNRQAYLSICNLDQSQYRTVEGRRWFLDDRIDFEDQLDNRYYKDVGSDRNLWDRGHLTRRTAITWGKTDKIARKASNESCAYTNACLQHRNFNQDEWRIPEEIAKDFARDKNDKLSIITGPLFTPNDRYFNPPSFNNTAPARIPSGFWKVIYYIDAKKSAKAGKDVLGCEAYLVFQDNFSMEDQSEQYKIDPRTLQVTITELQDLTGLDFPEPLYEANPLWYYTENRPIDKPERYIIKSKDRDTVKDGWAGHVIHERDDIDKHGFQLA